MKLPSVYFRVFRFVVAFLIIAFEMRVRRATLKTLIGAAVGSILGIVGAFLIGVLDFRSKGTRQFPLISKLFHNCPGIFYGLYRLDGRRGERRIY